MLCLRGFELCSSWVPLNTNHRCEVILRHQQCSFKSLKINGLRNAICYLCKK